MRRLGLRFLAVRAFDAGKVYVPFMVFQGQLAERLPEWIQIPWNALVIYYSVTRINYIFNDWITTRYSLDESGIRVERGWIFRSCTQGRWGEIFAVDVTQPLLHRFLKCYRVRIVLGAESEELIEIDGVNHAVVRDIQRVEVGNERDSKGPSEDSGSCGDSVIYKIRNLDYLLISVTYGQAFLIIPFMMGTYGEVAALVGLPTSDQVFEQVRSSFMAGVGALALAIVFGIGISYIKYCNYLVRRCESDLIAQFGMFENIERSVGVAHVLGIRIDQNLIMRICGYGSLKVVSYASSGGVQSFTVLPAARLQDIYRLANDFFSIQIQPARRQTFTTPTTAVLGVAIGLSFIAGWRLGWWASVLVVILGTISANRLTASLRVGDHIDICRGLLWCRRYLLSPKSVQHVFTLQQGRSELKSTSTCLIKILDRRPVSLFVPQVKAPDRARLLARVLDSSKTKGSS